MALIFWIFIAGAFLFLCGVILLLSTLRGCFFRNRVDEEIAAFGIKLKMSQSIFVMLVVMGSGALLMVPKIYNLSIDPRIETKYTHVGYGLCELRPYSSARNLSGGPDDQTKAVLQSLFHPPASDPQQMSQWGLQIARLLKEDREVLEAMQSAIVRSNYTPETVAIFCEARNKTESERTAYENDVLETINNAMGISQ
jgi:hypothetical protein